MAIQSIQRNTFEYPTPMCIIFYAPEPQQFRDLRLLAFQHPGERRGVELLVTKSEVCAVADQKLDHLL
ncbi:MAG: hypothetical protein LAO76_16880 [Acidobacteriia bacterium]|nr:hypothetical protein [Terriglobia bacterium]